MNVPPVQTGIHAVDTGDVRPTLISVERLRRMSNTERRVARNAIFARHGRSFRSPDLQAHFEAQEWYEPNPEFRVSDLSDEEKDLVRVIQMWERSSALMWSSFEDLDGDGQMDFSYVLEVDSQFAVLINDQVEVIPHYWAGEEDGHFAGLNVSVVNVDAANLTQQIVLSQHDHYDEDPGYHNWIVELAEGQTTVMTLGSGAYNSGALRFEGDGRVALRVSHCPDHEQIFRLSNHTLVLEEDRLVPSPYPCPACISGSASITMSDGTSRAMQDLDVGDRVWAYDVKLDAWKEGTIESWIQVRHGHLTQYELEESQVVATLDHPFFCPAKGWVSLDPDQTRLHYLGYDDIRQLETGDFILVGPNQVSELKGVVEVPGEVTYSIERLSWGDGFVANGAVVGTAQVRRPTAQD